MDLSWVQVKEAFGTGELVVFSLSFHLYALKPTFYWHEEEP